MIRSQVGSKAQWLLQGSSHGGVVTSPRLVCKLAKTAGDKLSRWFDSFYLKNCHMLCCRKENAENQRFGLLVMPCCLGITCLFTLRS